MTVLITALTLNVRRQSYQVSHFCSVLTKTVELQQILVKKKKKPLIVKCFKNLSSCSTWTDMDRRNRKYICCFLCELTKKRLSVSTTDLIANTQTYEIRTVLTNMFISFSY
jgi:hypothetical protein